MMKKGSCPMCGWYGFQGKMHDKIHQRMGDDCCGKGDDCCGHNHEEQN